MTCDNCQLAEDNHGHRCRANESSCIDGTDCPDYIEQCDCQQCGELKVKNFNNERRE